MAKLPSTGLIRLFPGLLRRLRDLLFGPGTGRRNRRILLWTAGCLLLLLALSFSLRNVILRQSLQKYVSRFNRAVHADLRIGAARIKGISSLQVTGIMLRPEDGDTLLRIDSAYATVSFLKLLTGRVVLEDFALKNTMLSFVKQDTVNNYMFLLDRKPSGDTLSAGTAMARNYAARMRSILDAAFDKVPDDLLITRFTVSSLYNGHRLSFRVDTFAIVGHAFRSPIRIEEDGHTAVWMVDGVLDKHSHTARFALYNTDSSLLRIPFLQYRYHAAVSFDTLRFSLREDRSSHSEVRMSGEASLAGLTVDHPRIASETIGFGRADLSYAIHVGTDYLELDSSTSVTYNGLQFNPYLRYLPKPIRQVTLKIDKTWFPAQELFSSLPAGLFQNLEGLKTKGDLSFHLLFDANLYRPDSLVFECELKRKNFFISAYGRTHFPFINDTFTYTAYERGEAVRTFQIGPANPNYRTLDQIPAFLKNSVLNSEDGAFFSHRGFLHEAFRESIAANIREGRFARGGSTITMQLVKNVFLNRNKTIARKLEEVIIVWLMENLQLSTKERMFEVYLNLIEWGPLVYGAQEASRYYFSKDLSKLTYAEAIFLASIIPRPKHFMWSFDRETGQFRDFVLNYYRRMADKMLKKEMITQEDYDNLVPAIEMKGPAKLLLQARDSSLHEPERDIPINPM